MEKTLDSWSDYYRYRKTLRNRFGPIWDVPIIKRELPLILVHLGKGARVLEIGASRSNRYLPGTLELVRISGQLKTVALSPSFQAAVAISSSRIFAHPCR